MVDRFPYLLCLMLIEDQPKLLMFWMKATKYQMQYVREITISQVMLLESIPPVHLNLGKTNSKCDIGTCIRPIAYLCQESVKCFIFKMFHRTCVYCTYCNQTDYILRQVPRNASVAILLLLTTYQTCICYSIVCVSYGI